MLILKGNYVIKLDFGKDDVAVDTSNIKEFTIVHDMNKMLPEFRIQLYDPQGALTHVIPFDKSMSRVGVQISDSLKNVVYNNYNFVVYRRQPEGVFASGAVYDIRGLLDVNSLFAPSFPRSFSGTLASTLETIAGELGVDKTDISPNLNYVKAIVQPNWSNMMFLNYLSKNMVGSDGDAGYNIFVRQREGKSTFVCRSFKELHKEPVQIKLLVNDLPVEDFFPVLDYQIFDNYKLFGSFGGKVQDYNYFDYYNSEFVEGQVLASEMFSLSEFFLIDGDDQEGSIQIDCGTNNEFTRDFKGKIRSGFFRRLNNLNKIWCLTWGQPNVCAGDVAKLLFAQGKASGNLQSYQFSGYWLVERVVHSLTDTYRTRFLLTRCGLDTDKGTTLVRAERYRK